MVDRELVSRKLSRLRGYLDELRLSQDITWRKYQSDLRTRAFVERYIHLAIEEVIDVANHLVSSSQWREPTSFRDLFSILAQHGVIPDDQLLTYQNMASFRNMLVHRYESIEDEVVFGIFKKRLGDFDLFIGLVGDWVKGESERG
jgi:uncharacterized protein YutE (UPF0331/DUF86 family)